MCSICSKIWQFLNRKLFFLYKHLVFIRSLCLCECCIINLYHTGFSDILDNDLLQDCLDIQNILSQSVQRLEIKQSVNLKILTLFIKPLLVKFTKMVIMAIYLSWRNTKNKFLQLNYYNRIILQPSFYEFDKIFERKYGVLT